jgi:deoxyribodipyrimidine photolyase-related protein
MKEIFILLPIHLYKDISILENYDIVYLIEEIKYFDRNTKENGSMKLNIMKPIYHRMTMKRYEKYLKTNKINVKYLELNYKNDLLKIISNKHKKDNISFYDIIDRDIERRCDKYFDSYDVISSPSFFLSYEECESYSGAQRQTSFYSWMRKKFDILMTKDCKYEGGKLTYDTNNRKSPYKNMDNDVNKEKSYTSKYLDESIRYINKKIPKKNVNSIYFDKDSFRFPIDHKDSENVMKKFIKNKLDKFGDYQDAILQQSNSSFLFHSGISVMMNIGLITPKYVVNSIIKEYQKYDNKKKKQMLNNVEGFIRQILGWREYCRYTYEFQYKKFNNKNFFNSKNKLSKEWYNGTTKSKPVDECIIKAFRYGYLHHIERLMIVSNYMLISNIHPKEVFKWFSEFSLDSYDWVMEYNIYSMATYSDGGNFTTKPYISSSNYILKMSDYKKGKENEEWINEWDKKFWMFMDKHSNKIKKINRLGMLLKHTKNNLKKLKNVKILN